MDVPEFDPRAVKPDTVLAFFGMRGGGKTFCCEDIIFNIRRFFDDVIAFSATEHGNHTWEKHFPRTFVHCAYSRDALQATIARQTEINEKWDLAGRRGRRPRLLIVLEDLMAENKSEMNSGVIRALFMNARHIGITVAITVQYLMDLPRPARMNIDYAFIQRDRNIGNIRRIHETWCGTWCEAPDFERVMTTCTAREGESRGTLVITVNADDADDAAANARDDGTSSAEPNALVTWYRATPRGNYRVGSRALWAFHYRYAAGEVYGGADANAGSGAGASAASSAGGGAGGGGGGGGGGRRRRAAAPRVTLLSRRPRSRRR